MEKGKIKAAEMRKLKRIFKEIPENKKKIVEKLIDNAAFMAEQLEHLQTDIEEKGPERRKSVGDEESTGG